MQRVMIVGQPGSGKSTLARKLGEHTGLPAFISTLFTGCQDGSNEPVTKKRASVARSRPVIAGYSKEAIQLLGTTD